MSRIPARAIALITTAALLATMTAATVAAPASAAKPKPKCQGKVATIVGTKKGEVIRGTARRDVIVAKGGADRIYARGGNDLICAGTGNDRVFGGPGADVIWGQLGHDRLFGNTGNDFLAGQVGNDTLNGGLNSDTCYQGTGSGAVLNCELPAPPAAPAPVAPPSPPPVTLVVAYTDVNANHAYEKEVDIMIAEIVDTNGTGMVDPGDTINMGLYPTRFDAVAPARLRQTMEPWGVKSHPVTTADLEGNQNVTVVESGADYMFTWWRVGPGSALDVFIDRSASSGESSVYDYAGVGADQDIISYEVNSPSRPIEPLLQFGDSAGDDHYIDVEIFAP